MDLIFPVIATSPFLDFVSPLGLLEAPGRVQAVVLTSTMVQVSWDSPFTLENVPIIRYSLEVQNKKGIQLLKQSSNRTILNTSLLPDLIVACEQYKISVVAVNAVGNGKAGYSNFYYYPQSTECSFFCPFLSAYSFCLSLLPDHLSCPFLLFSLLPLCFSLLLLMLHVLLLHIWLSCCFCFYSVKISSLPFLFILVPVIASFLHYLEYNKTDSLQFIFMYNVRATNMCQFV